MPSATQILCDLALPCWSAAHGDEEVGVVILTTSITLN